MKYILIFLIFFYSGCAYDTGISSSSDNTNSSANYEKLSKVTLYENITIDNIYFTNKCEKYDIGGNIYPCITFYNNSDIKYDLKIQFSDYCNNEYKINDDYLTLEPYSFTNIHSLTCYSPKTYKIEINTLYIKENYVWNVIWTGHLELNYNNFN